jgi:DNA polymerase-3 subunit gamma/tau
LFKKLQDAYFYTIMSEYIVSARKYRPVQFKSMVGQEHVSNTLRNAIKSEQLAHSFLFCGPRGVGKTTAARILAKTINCENKTADYEACGACPSCVAFQQNSSFNIYELDAASNNSVEDIRELVNQVRFPPQSGKYKIYIIDEVHMLSSGAFNAFLKTLEEPPSYCKFILATTEKHKILPTILSRCQIFDFRRIGIDVIVSHLKDIAQKENIPYEEDALHIVAQKADGGMRDALSMFDRLVSFGGGKLVYSEVLENLNVLDYEYFFRVTDALLAEDLPKVMQLFNEIVKKGFEGDDFMTGLCEHFRNLLFCKNTETVKLLEVSETLKIKYLSQAKAATGSFLVSCLSIGNQSDVQYKLSKNKRLTVELALVKMCYVNRVIDPQTESTSKKAKVDAAVPSTEQRQIQQNSPETPQAMAETTAPVLNHLQQINESLKPTSAPAVAPPPATPGTPPPARINKSSKLIMSMDHLDMDHSPRQTNDPQQVGEIKVSYEQQELSQLLVEDIWKSFGEDLREKKLGTSHHFTNFSPVLQGTVVHVKMLSGVQKNQLEGLADSLIAAILRRCGKTVTFEVSVDEKQEMPKKFYYTSKEKFERMMEKNPNVKLMQRMLGLELDE